MVSLLSLLRRPVTNYFNLGTKTWYSRNMCFTTKTLLYQLPHRFVEWQMTNEERGSCLEDFVNYFGPKSIMKRVKCVLPLLLPVYCYA